MRVEARLLALAALVTAAGHPGAAAHAPGAGQAAQAAPGGLVRLSFDWGARGRVKVSELLEKVGRTVGTSYALDYERAEDGRTTIRIAGFQVDRLNEASSTSPAFRATAAELASVLGALPSRVITAEGRFEGIADHQLAVERAAAAMVANGASAEQVSTYVNARSAPAAVRQAETSARELWDAWVGHWVGLELAPGTPRTSRTDLAAAPGRPALAIESSASLEGFEDQGGRRCARLVLSRSLQGDGALALALAELAVRRDPTPRAAVARAVRRERVELLTEPNGLRPQRAVLTTRYEIELTPEGGQAGRPPLVLDETRTFSFAWPAEPAAPVAPVGGG